MPTVIIAGVALAVAFLALAIALGVAIRMNRLEMVLRPDLAGLEVGSVVPQELLLAAPPGRRDDWLEGPVVVGFVSADCDACRQLVQRLNADPPRDFGLVLVQSGESGVLRNKASFAATWLDDPGGSLRRAFKVTANPHLFLIKSQRVAAQTIGPDLGPLGLEWPAETSASVVMPSRS